MMHHYDAFKHVQIKLPPFENNLKENSLSQFSRIENNNRISLVVYMLYAHNNDKENMTVSLIRKGKSGIPEDKIVNLLQINGNHVCYITDLVLFLKAFFNLKKNKEICVLCLVQLKKKHN